MFRDVLNQNISERVLTRLVNTVFRLRSQLVMTLEKINSKRATKQDWLTDSQFKSGQQFSIFKTEKKTYSDSDLPERCNWSESCIILQPIIV